VRLVSITNFETALPAPQSDLAQQRLKPRQLRFLTLSNEAQERHLERGLPAHLRQFLLKLGVGFSFVGNQVPLIVRGSHSRWCIKVTRSEQLSAAA
jgi:predicted nuclease of restriction endonuclease-like (RecB) superfamily